jgi:hypothetical protein
VNLAPPSIILSRSQQKLRHSQQKLRHSQQKLRNSQQKQRNLKEMLVNFSNFLKFLIFFNVIVLNCSKVFHDLKNVKIDKKVWSILANFSPF